METSTNPSKTPIKSRPNSENTDPNLPVPKTPSQKPQSRTPLIKSSSKPKKPIKLQQQQRKFVVAKKKKDPRNSGESSGFDPKKTAYEALRASQDKFFRKDNREESKMVEELKSLVMEEALSCVPEPWSGRVKHLVKAFESLLSISDDNDGGRSEGSMGE